MTQNTWDTASANADIKVAAFAPNASLFLLSNLTGCTVEVFTEQQLFDEYLLERSIATMPQAILIEADTSGKNFKSIEKLKKNPLLRGVVLVVIAKERNKELFEKARALKVHDFYALPYDPAIFAERLSFLAQFKLIKPSIEELGEQIKVSYKLPLEKRVFDVVFAGGLLLVLLPLFAVVAIAIRLESPGPVVYKSKRVGTGYRIFDFYKFRSMRPDADKLLAQLAKEKNQYAAEESGAAQSAFVKLKDDPRITKIGSFIRNTSIDELPQLFNILIGDMSTVGNRPLPLYEAEQLTSNEWADRFLAPAGLTGLWQVSKRGKLDMSERERKKLDNFYAQKHSFWLDMKILFSTIPAMFQKEKV